MVSLSKRLAKNKKRADVLKYPEVSQHVGSLNPLPSRLEVDETGQIASISSFPKKSVF